MNNLCPLMSGKDVAGKLQLMRCRSDCALNLGVDCALKILGISALKNIRSANAPSNKEMLADTQEK